MNYELRIKEKKVKETKNLGFFSMIHQQKGFAMLFAVLTSSLVLSIGLSIFNLTIKELALSSIGRESQFAFYAADTGAECAIYWDFNPNLFAFATSTESSYAKRGTDIDALAPTCAGTALSVAMKTPTATSGVSPGPSSGTTLFTLNINPEGYCAIVTVTKTYDAGGILTTSVDSRGYNTCVTTDPSRVERALKISY